MSRYDDVNRTWDDRAFKAYSKFTDRPGVGLTIGVLALAAVIAVVVLGGWWVGWWFKGQNVNRESHMLRNSYANQQTLRDQITQNIGNVLAIGTDIAATSGDEQQALKAQRVAVVNIVCGDAEQVTGDPLAPDQASFVAANCEAGSIRPGSPYTH